MKVNPDYYNTEKEYKARLGFKTYDKGLICPPDESKTQQHAKDECDINKIVEKFGEKELWNYAQTVQNAFGDVSNLPTYQQALQMVINAEDGFMELPAKVRSRFQNDPGQLIAFLNDKSNYDEALKLGLVNPRPKQTDTQKVSVGTITSSSNVPPDKPVEK